MAIGVHKQGRIGNQLFQFAFIYNLSKRLGVPFFVEGLSDLNWFEVYDKYLFKSRIVYALVKIRHYIKKLTARASKEKTFQSLNVIAIDDWTSVEKLQGKFKDNSFYVGYFQSFDFFKTCREEIVKLFTIKEQFQNEFRMAKGKYLAEKYIVAHIRRTDYVDWQLENLGEKNYSLPAQYYLNCFEKIKDIDLYKIIFLGDDETFYQQNFSQLENAVYEKNSGPVDFQLIQNAEIIILSNSSFAWWAAFLSKKAHRVFAPEYWIGFKVKKEFPVNIIYEGWEKTGF